MGTIPIKNKRVTVPGVEGVGIKYELVAILGYSGRVFGIGS